MVKINPDLNPDNNINPDNNPDNNLNPNPNPNLNPQDFFGNNYTILKPKFLTIDHIKHSHQ